MGRQIAILAECDESDFHIEAWRSGVRVGWAMGSPTEDGRLQLCDIQVFNSVVRPWPVLTAWMLRFWGPRKSAIFRGQGIGDELLSRFCYEADRVGFREIFGYIVEGDAETRPWLLRWYEKHGFAQADPDTECLPSTRFMVVRPYRGARRP